VTERACYDSGVKWSYLELGIVKLVAPDPRGVLVEYEGANRYGQPRKLVRLVPTGDTFVAEHTVATKDDRFEPAVPEPFERTSLGKKSRLAWPNGATTIGMYDHLTGWSDRYAIVPDDRGFTVIDAESDRVVRLVLPQESLRWKFGDPIACAGHVWLLVDEGVVAIPFAQLESPAVEAFEITLVRHFPMRRPQSRLACVFLWFLQNGNAMVEIGDGKGGVNEQKLTITMPKLGLAKYEPIALVDELRPFHYATLEARDERISIADTSPRVLYGARVTSTRAKDPAGVAKAPKSAVPSRRSTDEIDRLVAALAANPDDDAQRAVLADLLLEVGDPSAEAIAALRAGGKLSPAKLKTSLGALGPYLTKVEHAGGFPAEATVMRDAPDAEDHAAELDAACADFRLSLIHTLHSQRGRRASSEIYARLVGAPKATSLRRVDVSDFSAIEALIAADRNKLEYLEHVDFAEAKWMEKLATQVFDRVTTLHTVVGLAHLQPLVNRVVRDKSKFFKRAPRALVLEETRDRNAELLRALAPSWPQLPLTAVTVAGVTVKRSGEITGDDAKLVAVAKRAFAG
jgi:uncharacterized protein (TIGR02996 family)